MKVKYFSETDTLYIEFRDDAIAEIRELDDDQLMETQLVTVYEPTLDRWEPGFRKRRT